MLHCWAVFSGKQIGKTFAPFPEVASVSFNTVGRATDSREFLHGVREVEQVGVRVSAKRESDGRMPSQFLHDLGRDTRSAESCQVGVTQRMEIGLAACRNSPCNSSAE